MPQVQLDDQVFKVAQRQAADAGFASVDAYIADVVVKGADGDDEDFDHRFTPELIALLDQIVNEMKVGNTASQEEIDQHLANVREAWIKDHAS